MHEAFARTSDAYQVGGSLPPQSPTYVKREADDILFEAMQGGNFCYVFNARQMGKSSLRLQTMRRLEAVGVRCGAIDLSAIGTQQVSQEQWYAAIAGLLSKAFGLSVNLRQWWRDGLNLPAAARLSEFIDRILLVEIQAPLAVFLDEIDSMLSLNFPTDDFFALVRNCYNRRAESPEYRRLNFALFGVTTPGELIADKTKTPFNIGRGIALQGFEFENARPLAQGLAHWVPQPETALQRILYWTGGQPFLTQKLCALLSEQPQNSPHLSQTIDELVQRCVLQNWEAQDDPEHLKTIRDRLLYDNRYLGQLLSLYQQVWHAEQYPERYPNVAIEETPVQTHLLLSGVVEKRDGRLRVKNPIYQAVFNADWIARNLDNLRPYAKSLNAWLASGGEDSSRLLRGQALQEALMWTRGKALSDADYRYLAASQDLEQQEEKRLLELQRLKEVEVRLAAEHQSLRRQRQLLGVVSTALVGAIALGTATFRAYQLSAISQVRATVAAADGNFASNQRLDAVVQALQARHNFDRLNFLDRETQAELDRQTNQALQRTVRGVNLHNRIRSHPGGALGIDFSPDGRWMATGGTDLTVKLWKLDGTLVRRLPQQATVFNLRFSPDSQRIATPQLNGKILIHALDGSPPQILTGHDSPVWQVVWSPDGSRLLSTDSNGSIKLWSAQGKQLKTINAHDAMAWRVEFSPDGQQFASSSPDGVIRLWQADGTLVRTLQASPASVWGLAYTPDGDRFVTSHADRQIRIWSRDGELLNTWEAHESEVLNLDLSPDGQTLASVSADRTLKLWSLDGTLKRTFEGHQATVRGVSFSPDGQTVASASDDGFTYLWRIRNDFSTPLYGHDSVIWWVAVAPPTSSFYPALATVSHKRTQLWQPDGRLRQIFEHPSNFRALSLAFHPQLPELTVAGSNGSLARITQRDRPVFQEPSQDNTIFALAYYANGNKLFSGNENGQLSLWQQQADGTLKLQKIISAHQARIWSVTLSPDESYLVSTSTDKTAKIWRVRGDDLVEQHTLDGHTSEIWGAAISHDSQQIATASRDGTVKLWSRDGQLQRTLVISPDSGLTRLAMTPDGERLAIARVDGKIELRTLEGENLATLSGHESSAIAVAITPDGKFLLSGSDDRSAAIWNLDRVLDTDLEAYGCHWVRDYLTIHEDLDVSPSLCRHFWHDDNAR